MKKYIIHWLDGNVTEIDGENMDDAFRRLNYGSDSITKMNWVQEKGKNNLGKLLMQVRYELKEIRMLWNIK